MIIRSRAPLRLGFAGGGTDVSPYSEKFGGYVLNATVSMFSYCTLQSRTDNRVQFEAPDIDASFEALASPSFEIKGELILHKAVYNRVVEEFNRGRPLPLTLTSYSDAPPGCGLGSSSTMVVALLSAFKEYLSLPLGEYDVARLAYEIERNDCGLSGGKQDQYAATFGGFNFMEFGVGDRVVVNPLRIKRETLLELEAHMLLINTGKSRHSGEIIDEQVRTITANDKQALTAMNDVKSAAYQMKEALLKGRISEMANVLTQSWQAKKRTSKSVTNEFIERIEACAISSGASALKLSGAGGGGFMMVLVDPMRRIELESALLPVLASGAYVRNINFCDIGAITWRI